MNYDLHTHSHHSDGLLAPADVAARAAQAGLAGLALTDHDTCAGWDEMAAACRGLGLSFVPGVELSTEEGGRGVHILGYWVDRDEPAFAAECARLAGARLHRAEEMLERLAGVGVDVPMEEVLRHADGAPIGRPHVAEAMVAVGAVPDVPTAFERYLGEDQPGYAPKRALAPEDGVALIRRAGGVAVLAHPGVDRGRGAGVPVALLDRLTARGLVGVEADHPGHDEAEAARWRFLARERGLVVTGSSDFHGRYEEESMGNCTTAPEVMDRLARHTGAPAAVTEGN